MKGIVNCRNNAREVIAPRSFEYILFTKTFFPPFLCFTTFYLLNKINGIISTIRNLYAYTHIFESGSKISQPYTEKRTIAEHLLLQQPTITRKSNSDFCLNFHAFEAHKKVTGV